MTYRTDKECCQAILTSKRAYWARQRVRLSQEAKQRYRKKRPDGWIDGRRKGALARVSVAEIDALTTLPELRTALLGIREIQEKTLRHTHGSLREWCCELVKSILEVDGAAGADLIQRERTLFEPWFAEITAQLVPFTDDGELYHLAVKMGAHTRDGVSCLQDVEEKFVSGDLLASYVEHTLYSDLYTS